MNKEKVCLDWINCLKLGSQPIKRILDLPRSGCFASLLKEFGTKTLNENEETEVVRFIKDKYPDFELNTETWTYSEQDIECVSLLFLIHLVLRHDNVQIRNMLCSQLSSTAQYFIKHFLEEILESGHLITKDIIARAKSNALEKNSCAEEAMSDICSSNRIITTTTPSTPKRLSGSALRDFYYSPNTLKHQLEEKVKELNRLKFEYEAEVTDKTNLIEQNSELQLTINKLRKETEERMEQNEKLMIELNKLELEQSLSDLKASDQAVELDKWKKEVTYLENYIKMLEHECGQQRSELESCISQIKLLKNKQKDLSMECEKCRVENVEKEERYMLSRAELDETRTNLKNSEHIIQELNQEISQLRAHINAQSALEVTLDLELRLSDVLTTNQELNQKIESLQLDKNYLTLDIEKCKISLNEKMYAVNSLSEELKKYKELNLIMVSKTNELSFEKSMIDAKIRNMEAVLNKMEREVVILRNDAVEMNTLRVKNQELITQNGEFEEKIVQLQKKFAEIYELKTELEKENECLQKVKKQLTDSELTKTSFENKNKSLNEYIRNQSIYINNVFEDAIESRSKITDLEEKINSNNIEKDLLLKSNKYLVFEVSHLIQVLNDSNSETDTNLENHNPKILMTKLKSSVENLQTAKLDLSKMTLENTNLEKQNQELEHNVKNMKIKLENTNEIFEKVKEDFSNLELLKTNLEIEKQALKGQIKQLTSLLSTTSQEAKELMHKIKNLTQDINSVNEQKNDLLRSNKYLVLEIDNLIQVLSSSDSSTEAVFEDQNPEVMMGKLKLIIESLQAEKEAVQLNFGKISSENEGLVHSNERLKHDICELRTTLGKENENYQEIMEELIRAELSKNNLEKENQNLARSILVLNSQIVNITEEAKKVTEEAEKSMSRVNEEKDKLLKDKNYLVLEIDRLIQVLSSSDSSAEAVFEDQNPEVLMGKLKLIIESLQAEKEAVQLNFGKISLEHKDLVYSNERLKHDVCELRMALQKENENYQEIRGKLTRAELSKNNLEKENQDLVFSNERLNHDVCELRMTLEKENDNYREIREELTSAELSKNNLEKENQNLAQNILALNSQIVSLTERAKNLTGEAERSMSRISEEKDKLLKDKKYLVLEIDRLIQVLSSSDSSAEAVFEDQNSQILMAKLKLIIENLQAEKEAVQLNFGKISSENEDLVHSNEILRHDICELKTTLEKENESYQEIREKLTRAELSKNNLEKENQDLVCSNERLKHDICELRMTLEKENENYQEIREELTSAELSKNNLEKENQNLAQNILALNSQIVSLTEKAKNFTEEAENSMSRISEEKDELLKNYKYLVLEIDRLIQVLSSSDLSTEAVFEGQTPEILMGKLKLIIENLQAEKEAVQLNFGKISSENEDLVHSNERLKHDICELKTTLEKENENYKEIREELTRAELSKNNLEKENQNMAQSILAMNSQIVSLTEKAKIPHNELKKVSLELQQECRRLKHSIAQMEEEKKANEKRDQQFKEKITEQTKAYYEGKFERAKMELKKVFVQQQNELAEEWKQREKNYKKMVSEQKEQIDSLTKQFWDVSDKYLKLQQANTASRESTYSTTSSRASVYSPSGLGRKVQSATNLNIWEYRVPPMDFELRSLPNTSECSLQQIRKKVGPTTTVGKVFPTAEEEGEVFDNIALSELTSGDRTIGFGCDDYAKRLSVLQERNSLCRPHLKSSYPLDFLVPYDVKEEEIKSGVGLSKEDVCDENVPPAAQHSRKNRNQTSYRKPGPPTPTKNGGKTQATDVTPRPLKEQNSRQNGNKRRSFTPSRLLNIFSAKAHANITQSNQPPNK